jgi:hypothetical protein
MPIKFLIFLAAMMAAWPAIAQTNKFTRDEPSAISPLPADSCLLIDQGPSPGHDRSLCSGWAVAFGAFSALLDTQSVAGAFALPSTDAFKIVYRTNFAAQADTIDTPATAGFGVGFGSTYFSVAQGNSLTPQNNALINGRANIMFGSNQGAVIFSDGVGYRALVGLPTTANYDGTRLLSNDNTYKQVGAAQLAPGAVTTPALASGLNLTSPSITLGSDAPGDTYYRASNGSLARLAAPSTSAVSINLPGACATDPNTLVVTCQPGTPSWQAQVPAAALPLATNSTNGAGRPDGQSISIDAGGVYRVPLGIDSGTTGLTAAGTTQANCTALTTQQNYVSTVPSSSGVCLPAAVRFGHAFVCNETTTPLLVYAQADGTIINTPSGPLAPTQAISVGRGCPEFIAKSSSSWWVTGAGVPLVVQ